MLHVDDGRFPFLGYGALPDVPNQFDGLFALRLRRPGLGTAYRDLGYRTLAASKISGIVFETTDTYDDSSSQIRIDVVEATDDAGNPENAAALFDSFFEWNASPY